MAGFGNGVSYCVGQKIMVTTDASYPFMQENSTDVGQYNNSGTPEGVIPANAGSICFDRTGGDLYVKSSGTDDTDWSFIYKVGSIVDPSDGGTGIDNGDLTIDLSGGQAGYVATSDADGNLTLQPSLANFTIVVQKFDTVGTFTYTPTPGMKAGIAETTAGGGGGGGASANSGPTVAAAPGGGGGGFARKFFTAADIGVSQTVTVGAAGSGGSAGNNSGGNGGASSVGSLCAASGGLGGTGAPSDIVISNFEGGTNGTGTIGDILVSGIVGSNSYGIVLTGIGVGNGGDGGASIFGGNGPGGRANQASANGGAAGNYGSGGGGGMSGGSGASAASGGDGGQGFVIIIEYISS